MTNGPSDKLKLRVIEQAAGGAVMIEGELAEDNAAEFQTQMRALNADLDCALRLDLSGLDIDDGIALAVTINSLRELRARSARLILTGAPQILGHNLYRVGLLDGGGNIELIDMRLDEPHG